jgi:L-threonylcarbamoyladenylate synthase
MSAEPSTRALPATAEAVKSAAQCLAAGGLIAFPTETVYGLGADATNGTAVAKLYAAKGRPSFNPLIVHVADISAARKLARFDADAEKLATAFWPGPLTLVLPKAAACPVSDLATAGLDSIALRVPDHRVARELMAAFGRPIVAPSANRSGHVSPTTAAHVMADLRGRIDLVVDGGAASVGVESSIVACLGDQPRLLRPGGLARDAIEALLGHPLTEPEETDIADEAPLAPGMLSSHYAPRARLRLEAESATDGEALLAFGAAPRQSGEAVMLNLSPRGDLVEAAANLFSHLRALDASGATAIAVMPVPMDGLGEAINDRLRRAAAPRPSR